jgi:hypothetical protein
MKEQFKTLESGILFETGDTWLLEKPNQFISLDMGSLIPSSLLHKNVSVIGKMGIPPSSGELKLMVEKITSHDDIAKRAYALFESGANGSANDQWYLAERELLGV